MVRRLAFVLLMLVASGCWSGRYLAKQGKGQLDLLRALLDGAVQPSL